MLSSPSHRTCPLRKRGCAAITGALHAGATARPPPPPPAAAAAATIAPAAATAAVAAITGTNAAAEAFEAATTTVAVATADADAATRVAAVPVAGATRDALHFAAAGGGGAATRTGPSRRERGHMATPVGGRGDTQPLGVSRGGWLTHPWSKRVPMDRMHLTEGALVA